jgi:hypothetical protein
MDTLEYFMLQDIVSLKPNVSGVYMGNGVLWAIL